MRDEANRKRAEQRSERSKAEARDYCEADRSAKRKTGAGEAKLKHATIAKLTEAPKAQDGGSPQGWRMRLLAPTGRVRLRALPTRNYLSLRGRCAATGRRVAEDCSVGIDNPSIDRYNIPTP